MKTPRVVIVGHVCIDENKTENTAYSSWGSSVLYIDNVFQKEYDLKPAILTEYGPDILQYYSNSLRE
jgi:hypothetical protein